MSETHEITPIPLFIQTFATNVLPFDPRLPELLFVLIPRNTGTDITHALTSLLPDEFAEGESDDDSPELQLREFVTGDTELLELTIATHLRNGATGRLAGRLPKYTELAADICEHAEIPIRSSPLKGVTLSSLAGGAGSISILQLFHSGVSPAEASLSVLFVAGAMVIFGAANAVRRAIEIGLEQKLLKVFGIDIAQTIGHYRNSTEKAKRVRRKATVKTRETAVSQSEVAVTARDAAAARNAAV